MCMVFFAAGDPEVPLMIAANRDEFYDRPTAPMTFWPDHPDLLAGRDIRAGGTWLGITRSARVAFITNYRGPRTHENPPSRGHLVRDFLIGDQTPEDFGTWLVEQGPNYEGFNLVFGTSDRLFYYGNRANSGPEPISPGAHGLSNGLLDEAWPKLARGKARFTELRDAPPESVFAMLADRSVPADEDLPETGVGLEIERILAPIFIDTDRYGTRCSTVLRVDRRGEVTVEERSFEGGPERYTSVCHRFQLAR